MKTVKKPVKKTVCKMVKASADLAAELMENGVAYKLFLSCSERAKYQAAANPGYPEEELFRLRFVEILARVSDEDVDAVAVAGIIINRYMEIAESIPR
jgi:hypothetical protein